ncbi:MBL fold metallo-hydrolase [Paenibacillus sp. FSL M8-0334]|uniref:MBL fold metallo-hydrolase n=1 Tax=Paenibacillus sp. FSL M8-0334 TaxID=2921623 RepID=UPI0030FA801F
MYNYRLLDIQFKFNGQEQTLWPIIIHDESDVILVDCGYPDFLHFLEEAVTQNNITFDTITKLILTHHDVDHVGSAAALIRKYPHIEISAFDAEIQYINGTKKPLRLVQAESSLHEMTGEEKRNAEHFIHFLRSVEPVHVDRKLHTNEYLPWCGGIKVIHTPGHTEGHISLYLPANKTLIAGDAIVIEDGKLNIANPQYAWDLDEAVRSVQRLLTYDIARIVCYHGGLFQGDVKSALRQLLKEYR